MTGDDGGGNGVDYASLPIPSDDPQDEDYKPLSEYSWAERRARIYELIEEAGHPRLLEVTQKELAKRFEVSESQISQDIDKLREYEAGRIGDQAESETSFVAKKAVRELLKEEKYCAAASLQFQWYDWLFATGRRSKEPEKLELQNPSEAYVQSLKQRYEEGGEEAVPLARADE